MSSSQQVSIEAVKAQNFYEAAHLPFDIASFEDARDKTGRPVFTCPRCKHQVLWLIPTKKGKICEDCLDAEVC
jgi:hypothetical protein